MTEHDIMNEIRLELGKRGIRIWRANVGKVRMSDGRFFDTGLPKGFPDLFGVMPDGRAIFIEVKKPGGRLRDEQVQFQNMIGSTGAIVGVAHSAAEAVELCRKC